jgi:hypothetical protein
VKTLASANEKVRTRAARTIAAHLGDAAAQTRTASLDALRVLKQLPSTDLLAPRLADEDDEVRSAALACLDRPARLALIDAILPSLERSSATQLAALKALHKIEPARLVELAPRLVSPLRSIVRGTDPELVRSAIYVLTKLGPEAKGASLDIARALAVMRGPYQGHQALVAIGAPLDEVVEVLSAFVEDAPSRVAMAAAGALKALGGVLPEVPVSRRLERAGRELAADDPDDRRAAMRVASDLGAQGVGLIPALHELGMRLAVSEAVPDRAELSAVRETLTALGVPADDLPRPPSRLAGYRGLTPRTNAVRGPYVIGSLSGFVSHGAVTIPYGSLGLWDDTTGALLFVIERAQLLDLIPGRTEVAVIRTVTGPEAKHGGTSRADLVWTFERHAVPSGDLLASLVIPPELTYGWPGALTFKEGRVRVLCGDEDRPYHFDVDLLPEGDRLRPWEGKAAVAAPPGSKGGF